MKIFVNSKLFAILAVLLTLAVSVTSLSVALTRLDAVHAASQSQARHITNSLQEQRPSTQSSSNPLDWPEFHLNTARDGNQSSDTMLSKDNAGSLVHVSGQGFAATGSAMSSPAIYQGILYYTTEVPQNQVEASTLYAVDVMSGQTLWSEQFPQCGSITATAYLFSSPAVTTGMVNGVATTEVFIGWGNVGPGCVYDFNGQTGALIWAFPTASAVYSSPAITSTNNGPVVVVGDNNAYVHAFSINYIGALGGKPTQLWRYNDRTDQPPPGYAHYCTQGGSDCGDAVWSSPAEGQILINGVLHHYAYFGVGSSPTHIVGRLDAIDLDTIVNKSPVLAWSFWDQHPTPDNDFGTVLVYSDQNGMAVRVYTGTNAGDMYALDATTGQMDFDFNTAAQVGIPLNMIHSTGTLVNSNGKVALIFGSGCSPTIHNKMCQPPYHGYVFAIDALSTSSSGTELWHTQDFGGDFTASPVAVNQGAEAVVFIPGPWYPGTQSRGDLLALDPATGTILGDYQVYPPYVSISTPAIYGGRIYVTIGITYIYIKNNPAKGGLAAFRCSTCP